MSFSQDAWRRNLPLYEKTLAMPFNAELAAGTLGEAQFKHYIIQDAHYLEGFARALSLAAAKAQKAAHIVHFAQAAIEVLVTERALHESYFKQFNVTAQDFKKAEPSPGCEFYVSYLLRQAALEPFEVVLAALLPCFWIYQKVGSALHAKAASDHPYQAWMDTYAGDAFEKSVDAMLAIVDEVAAGASENLRALMHQAYTRAAQLEWMFWDSAYRQEKWDV